MSRSLSAWACVVKLMVGLASAIVASCILQWAIQDCSFDLCHGYALGLDVKMLVVALGATSASVRQSAAQKHLFAARITRPSTVWAKAHEPFLYPSLPYTYRFLPEWPAACSLKTHVTEDSEKPMRIIPYSRQPSWMNPERPEQ
jgi:hypothetical protein